MKILNIHNSKLRQNIIDIHQVNAELEVIRITPNPKYKILLKKQNVLNLCPYFK